MLVLARLTVFAGGIVCLIGCSATSQVAELPSTNRVAPLPMPGLNVTDTTGTRWTPVHFQGRKVLVEFWATWCAPCREVASELRGFARRNRAEVTVLSVSLDEDAAAFKRHVSELPANYPVAWGGPSISKEWGVTQMPALVLVKEGKVVFKWEGKEAVLQGLKTIEATR